VVGSIAPILASAGPLRPDSDKYAFEVKWDGYRALVKVSPQGVTITSRNGYDMTDRYRELQGLRGLAAERRRMGTGRCSSSCSTASAQSRTTGAAMADPAQSCSGSWRASGGRRTTPRPSPAREEAGGVVRRIGLCPGGHRAMCFTTEGASLPALPQGPEQPMEGSSR
jgi:hypothetical protein